jgi:DNA-binding transcriptional MerR regulator
MKRPITVSVLAQRMDVAPSTIRLYEAKGIIRARRLPNGYRVFDEDALSAMRFARHAKALGLSLADIVQVLELSRAGAMPCTCVRAMLVRNLGAVDQRIRDLRALRGRIRAVLARDPQARPASAICPLIDP